MYNNTTSPTPIGKNSMLKTFKQHSLMGIVIIAITAIITIGVLINNMNKYRESCQATFIYYKNGSSVLVNNVNNTVIK